MYVLLRYLKLFTILDKEKLVTNYPCEWHLIFLNYKTTSVLMDLLDF